MSSLVESPSFLVFSGLPREIRHEIYELALPPPRLIELHTARGEILFTNSSSNITRRRKKFKHIYANKVPVPTVLQVCQESRAVALRNYQLTFDSNPRPAKEVLLELTRSRGDEAIYPYETPAMIYVNLNKDIVFLTNEQRLINYASMPSVGCGLFENYVFTLAIPRDILCRIRRLALSNTLWNGSARFTVMRDHLRSPDALQRLVVLEARKDDELNSSWERRVEKILLKVPEPMRTKVRVLDEQTFRAAVASESLEI